jgi:hypothetical protein
MPAFDTYIELPRAQGPASYGVLQPMQGRTHTASPNDTARKQGSAVRLALRPSMPAGAARTLAEYGEGVTQAQRQLFDKRQAGERGHAAGAQERGHLSRLGPHRPAGRRTRVSTRKKRRQPQRGHAHVFSEKVRCCRAPRVARRVAQRGDEDRQAGRSDPVHRLLVFRLSLRSCSGGGTGSSLGLGVLLRGDGLLRVCSRRAKPRQRESAASAAQAGVRGDCGISQRSERAHLLMGAGPSRGPTCGCAAATACTGAGGAVATDTFCALRRHTAWTPCLMSFWAAASWRAAMPISLHCWRAWHACLRACVAW